MKKELPVYFLDSFTNSVFRGNPAAVCPLEKWLTDDKMQSIASENSLSETAFFVQIDNDQFQIRWFTPTVEVELCGHATLASAKVLYDYLDYKGPSITFHSKSGPLPVLKEGEFITLNFPGRTIEECDPTPELLDNFKSSPKKFLKSGEGTYIVVLDSESEVAAYLPNFSKLRKVDRCVNITAEGDSCDFVSRFFGPNIGLPEDAVTGSAHCGLAIYWSRKLDKTENLRAIQLSKRTGEILCKVHQDRVYLSGQATLYLKGKIYISQ